MKTSSVLGKYRLVGVCVASFLLMGGSQAFAQALNPFGNPFAALIIPQAKTRVEIGGDTAVQDGRDAEPDYAIRINHKVGKMAAVSGSIWSSPRKDDPSPTFQIGATGIVSQRASVWMNFGGSPTSENLPNAQYDFGGGFYLDQQLVLTGMVSIRNYQGGPSVKLVVPGVAWIVNPKWMLVATAITSSVSRLAPGVTAGSNLALFNVVMTPSPKLQLNVGTGYGETDFLAAASPTQTFAHNTASGDFDASMVWKFHKTHGLQVFYWLDNGKSTKQTNTFQASVFLEF